MTLHRPINERSPMGQRPSFPKMTAITPAATAGSVNSSGSYSVREILDRYESEEDEFLRELEDMRASLQNSEQDDENVVQRMSAIFDSHTNIFPRLRRATHTEIRTGARERLTTPPRKDPMSTSSISTDLSQLSTRTRAPPLVEPELSDSEIEGDYPIERRNRRNAIRRCDMSMSEYTSPSSASSSRDPSEAMTSSRSSFLELIGFRKRNVATSATSLQTQKKPIPKKRKRRVSDDESSGLYANIDDSDDSDNLRMKVKAKANSFLNVHNNYDHPGNLLRVDRETKLRHDKQNLEAEIEELKDASGFHLKFQMRNQRLVEQLRDKSVQFSKLQFHAHQLDEQIVALSQRCALNAALDKLTLDERLIKGSMSALEKVEDRLRHLQHQVQCAKLDAVNAQQKTLNNLSNERNAHSACLERLEELQREHFALVQSRYLESGCSDNLWKRKIDALPSYEMLYSFTQQLLRKYTDLKWSLLDKDSEMSRTELDLIAAQSSLLVTHAQVKRDMNFFLPFKLQGSRIENSRRIVNKKAIDHEKDLEIEFHKMFGDGRHTVPLPPTADKPPPSASSRIEYMMREMSSTRNRKVPPPSVRERPRTSSNRPMRPMDAGQIPTSSLQDLPFRNPVTTPVMSRKFSDKFSCGTYNELAEIARRERVRKLERGYSMDTHERSTCDIRQKDERKRDDIRENSGETPERRASRIQRSQPVHLTRIKPPSQIAQRKTVKQNRISVRITYLVKTFLPRLESRPPERHAVMEILDPPRTGCSPPPPTPPPPPPPPSASANPSRLSKADKKSWLDKIRNMKRT
ncbi:unnamed protein product [Angiostrongylus costaricensis]|uniref:PH domain-containing protein n=1 Tax=Angiostrongylus costaricensis TaxID=334426 RepID=A0A158PD23_ANGCS|nr:unnamed protein product [Angiostrongylus costaricensis]